METRSSMNKSERVLDLTTTIEQDGQKTTTHVQAQATCRYKNGWYYIQFHEAKGVSVLVKWNCAKQIILVRHAQATNRFVFIEGETSMLHYQSEAGAIPLSVETTLLAGRITSHERLSELEWHYHLKDRHQIIGNYHVRLQLLS